MINNYLDDLIEVQNTEAIAIYSIDNTLVDSWSESGFNKEVFSQIALHYLQVFSILDLKLHNYNEIVISHEKGQFYARILPDLLIVVSLKSMKDIPLVRLIINVKIGDLLTSKEFQKIRKKLTLTNQNLLDRKYLDESERNYLKKLDL
jgi:hypothetical protein